MIVGLGIDVAGIARIARAIERFDERFLSRLLTSSEHTYALTRTSDRALWVAGRLAAKEAAFKALGVPQGIGWHDVEVGRMPNGAAHLAFHGKALERARARRVTAAHLSISHDAGVACAVVVLESETPPPL